MTRLLRLLRAHAAAWLLVAAAEPCAALPPVTEELLAPLTSAYMRAVKPGEQAELYRELFQTVLERVHRSYPRDVDVPALIAEALKTIEPLEPQSGEPADVFSKSINAALAWLDPHSYYLDPQEQTSELSALEGVSGGGVPVLSWSMEGEVLVLRLAKFTGAVSVAMEKAIAEAAAVRQPRGVVLDLRGNLGGAFRPAVRTADAFLAGGEIASMRGRNVAGWRTWQADPAELLGGVPMVVLIDGGTASASELVAAALQENGRATVMGQKSFGKGSVQAIVPLGAGKGALYLTTALFHGPSGRSVQLAGVGPDVELIATPENRAWEWRREADRAHALPGTDEPPPPKARVDESRCAAPRQQGGRRKEEGGISSQAKVDPALACALVFLDAGGIDAFLTALDAVTQTNADTYR